MGPLDSKLQRELRDRWFTRGESSQVGRTREQGE